MWQMRLTFPKRISSLKPAVPKKHYQNLCSYTQKMISEEGKTKLSCSEVIRHVINPVHSSACQAYVSTLTADSCVDWARMTSASTVTQQPVQMNGWWPCAPECDDTSYMNLLCKCQRQLNNLNTWGNLTHCQCTLESGAAAPALWNSSQLEL